MKKLFCSLFLLLTLPLFAVSFYDFKDLLWGTSPTRNVGDLENFLFYEKLYFNQIDRLFEGYEEVDRIPKVIHFIWFGPKPYPEESKENVRSWIAHHPTWKIKFWTDSYKTRLPIEGIEYHDVDEIQMQNREFFNQSQNWGEKSDILRYEILFQEGGVYVDHDIKCFRSFDAMNGAYDLYAFLESPHINPVARVAFFPSNGLIGSIPGHPIMKETIRLVRVRWAQAQAESVKDMREDGYYKVMYRTFLSFVYAARAKLDDPNYDNICFPTSCWSSKIHLPGTDSEVLFCRHTFAGSWIPRTPPEEETKKQKKKKRK